MFYRMTKCLTANMRFGATAAVTPHNVCGGFERLSPA